MRRLAAKMGVSVAAFILTIAQSAGLARAGTHIAVKGAIYAVPVGLTTSAADLTTSELTRPEPEADSRPRTRHGDRQGRRG